VEDQEEAKWTILAEEDAINPVVGKKEVHRTLFFEIERRHVGQGRAGPADRPAERHYLCRKVDAMGGEKDGIDPERPRFHGRKNCGERDSRKKGLQEQVSNPLGKESSFRRKRGTMNKERLEWVISRLNQYMLTAAGDHFLKTASTDFERNRKLTDHQEERLETLYKEKSARVPNKNLTIKESPRKKPRARRPGGNFFSQSRKSRQD
jgi:hypothetical protein